MKFFNIAKTIAANAAVVGVPFTVIYNETQHAKKVDRMMKDNPNTVIKYDEMLCRGQWHAINPRLVDKETGKIVARI